MAQYLAPGVYVEEIPGPRSIEGVGTSTAAFIGPTRYGPVTGRPPLLTSYLDFARIYGDAADLDFDGSVFPNYMAMGVRGFFDEGGTSLYVVRTFDYPDSPLDAHGSAALPGLAAAAAGGVALPAGIVARFPGAAGNLRVTFRLNVGQNVLNDGRLTRVREFDLVWVTVLARDADGVPIRRAAPYVLRVDGGEPVFRGGPVDEVAEVDDGDTTPPAWRLPERRLTDAALEAGEPLGEIVSVQPLTVVVGVSRPTVNGQGLPAFTSEQTIGEFGFDPRGAATAITTVLRAAPASPVQALTVPIALDPVAAENLIDLVAPATPVDAPEDQLPRALAKAIFGSRGLIAEATGTAAIDAAPEVAPAATPPAVTEVAVTLTGGTDGDAPDSASYQGIAVGFADYQNDPLANPLNGLLAIVPVDDVSIVAAPGAASGWTTEPDDVAPAAQEINGAITTHCENMRYRVAALDTPAGLLPDGALDFRNLRSSEYAALYYPWITVAHPITGTRVSVPPAAFAAGIWARNDYERGVFKAPANEVVRSALEFESRIDKAQQALLNPQGVNCLRFFPGPGFLVWGARTISENPEVKYLSTRRYLNYLEKSIDEGTQWAVFEVNGPALWDALRHTVEGFLLGEWRSGALLGSKPEKGFFVRCDMSTMTPDDLANGRCIVVVGVAIAKPAEFVIFRISQLTAPTE